MASASAGIIPINAAVLNKYTIVVTIVPRIVALGTVVSGFLIFALGIVALSIPRKAKNVSIVVIVMADQFDSPLSEGDKVELHQMFSDETRATMDELLSRGFREGWGGDDGED